MKRASTGLLLILFFAGLGLVWWGETSKPPGERNIGEVVLPELNPVSADDIRRVEIAGGPETILLERGEAGAWNMLKPVQTAASRVSAEAFVRGLGLLKRLPMSDKLDGAPATFGLDKPERVVKLFGSNPDKPLATIELGKSLRDGRYVRRGLDGAILIVDTKLVGLADASAKSWREATLFQASTFQVNQLKVVTETQTLELERKLGQWKLAQPFRALAEEPKAEGILADLLSLRAANEAAYVADDVKDFGPYGLDKPTLTLEIKTANGKSQQVFIGKAAPLKEGSKTEEFYARRADLDEVVLVRDTHLKSLGIDPSSLRSLRLAGFDGKRIEFIRIVEQGRTVVLKRNKKDWELVEPIPGPAETADVDRFADAIAGATAAQTIDPVNVNDPILNPPRWAIEAWAAKDSGPRSSIGTEAPDLAINLGRDDPGLKTIFAQIPGDRLFLALPDTIVPTLPVGGVVFRPRNLLREEPRAITKMTIRRPDGVYVLEGTPGKTPADPTTWNMIAPVSVPADKTVVGNITGALANLKADRLIADRPELDDREGLTKAVLYLTWRVQGASESDVTEHRLRIGNTVRGQKDGARYARLDDGETVFSLGKPFLNLFDQELRDHKVFTTPFTAERVVKLEFDWPGRDKTITLLRVANPTGVRPNWKPVGADPGDFPLPRINPLVDELAGLETGRFAQYQGVFARFFGLTPARMTIKITLEAPKEEYILSFGAVSPAAPDKLAATIERTDDGSIFLLPTALWNPFIEPPNMPGDLPSPVFPPEVEEAGSKK